MHHDRADANPIAISKGGWTRDACVPRNVPFLLSKIFENRTAIRDDDASVPTRHRVRIQRDATVGLATENVFTNTERQPSTILQQPADRT